MLSIRKIFPALCFVQFLADDFAQTGCRKELQPRVIRVLTFVGEHPAMTMMILRLARPVRRGDPAGRMLPEMRLPCRQMG